MLAILSILKLTITINKNALYTKLKHRIISISNIFGNYVSSYYSAYDYPNFDETDYVTSNVNTRFVSVENSVYSRCNVKVWDDIRELLQC